MKNKNEKILSNEIYHNSLKLMEPLFDWDTTKAIELEPHKPWKEECGGGGLADNVDL